MVIGQSRGGVFAKALGADRPDLVAGVVTLGSPLRSQLAVHPVVLAQIGMVGMVGAFAGGHALSWRCLRGECCERFRAALRDPFPPEVGFVSLYSRSDGVVDWRACLDRDAQCVEVDASHIGMSLNAEAYRAIARRAPRASRLPREPAPAPAEPDARHAVRERFLAFGSLRSSTCSSRSAPRTPSASWRTARAPR